MPDHPLLPTTAALEAAQAREAAAKAAVSEAEARLGQLRAALHDAAGERRRAWTADMDARYPRVQVGYFVGGGERPERRREVWLTRRTATQWVTVNADGQEERWKLVRGSSVRAERIGTRDDHWGRYALDLSTLPEGSR